MPQLFQYGSDANTARLQGMEEGERQVMKIGNMATYMEQALASGNERAVQGAWNAVRPELEKMSGQTMSPTWLPEYEPKMQEAKARAAALRDPNRAPGAIQEFEALAKAAGYTPGSPEYQNLARIKGGVNPRAVGAAPKTVKIRMSDGTERDVLQMGAVYYAPDGAGGYVEIAPQELAGASLATPAPAAPMEGGPASLGQPEPFVIDDPENIPPQVIQGIEQAQGFAPPPPAAAPVGAPAGFGVSRSPEVEAGNVEAAKQAAQIAALPQRNVIEAEGAGMRTTAEQRAKADTEAIESEPARREKVRMQTAAIDNTLNQIDRVANAVDWTTTGIVGSLLGAVPGTPAYDLATTAGTVKANLGFDRLQQMRDASPTGGALGQVAIQELEALQGAVASLDLRSSPANVAQNLNLIKQHYNNWKQAVQQGAQAGTQRFEGAAQRTGTNPPQPQYGTGWSIRKVK